MAWYQSIMDSGTALVIVSILLIPIITYCWKDMNAVAFHHRQCPFHLAVVESKHCLFVDGVEEVS